MATFKSNYSAGDTSENLLGQYASKRVEQPLQQNQAGPLAPGQGRVSPPDVPQPSTGRKVLNFFEGLGSSLIEGVKTLGTDIGYTAKGLYTSAQLTSQTSMQNSQSARIAAEVKAASQLPTAQQRRKALGNIGTPQKYINEANFTSVDQIYKKFGIDSSADFSTRFMSALPHTLNAAFGVATAGEGLGIGMVVKGIKSIAADSISGLLVKTGLSAGAKSVSEGVAKTVGESILEEAGSGSKETLRQLTQNGTKVFSKTASQKLLGKMVNSGIVNGTLAAVDQYAQGNRLKSMDDKINFFKEVGMNFLFGAALEGIAGGVTTAIDVAKGTKVLKGIDSDLSKNSVGPESMSPSKSSKGLLADINSRLGTDYQGPLEKSQAEYLKKVSDAHIQVVRDTRVAEEEAATKAQLESIRQAKIDNLKKASATANLKRWNTAFTKLTDQTPIHQSFDDAAKHLTEVHGIEVRPVALSKEIPSSFSRNKITFKAGDFSDYVQQVSGVVPKILKENGVGLSYFKEELSKIPDSGVKELDTSEAKMQKIMSGLFSENVAKIRSDYPTISTAFDAIHGIVKKVTPLDAAQAFVRDNLPEHYADIEHTIEKEATKVVSDPITGATKLEVDPLKREKLWLDVQDMMAKGRSINEVTALIKKTVDKSTEMSSLRQAAADSIKSSKNPELAQQIFDKADVAISSVRNLDDRIAMWRQHLNTFKIPEPKITSPVENINPIPSIPTPTSSPTSKVASPSNEMMTVYRGGTTAEGSLPGRDSGAFISEDKGFAQAFATDRGKGGTLNEYQIKKSDVLDLSNPKHLEMAREKIGDAALNEILSGGDQGLPRPHETPAEQTRIEKLAKDLGFKGITYSETSPDQLFEGRGIKSIQLIDNSALSLKEGSKAPVDSPEITQKKSLRYQKLQESMNLTGKGPGYDPEVRAAEMKRASDFVVSNYEQAVKVALGDKSAIPDGVKNQSSFQQYVTAAAVDEAISRGHYSLVDQMISSSSSSATEAAQALSAGNVLYKNSGIGAIKDIQDSFNTSKKAPTKVMKQITELSDNLKKGTITIKEAHSILDSLTCT